MIKLGLKKAEHFLQTKGNFLSLDEIRILIGGTFLRGSATVITLARDLWGIPVALLLLGFWLDAERGTLLGATALVLLLSRASVGSKNINYLFTSTKTVVVLFWGFSVALCEIAISSLYHFFVPHLVGDQIGSFITFFFSLITLTPFHMLPLSAIMIVWGLFLLDSPPGIACYSTTLVQALNMVARFWLMFFILYLILPVCGMALLLSLLTTMLPVQISRCIAALMILPWYTAALAQWYGYMRFRKE
jgi:hypothetical protein